VTADEDEDAETAGPIVIGDTDRGSAELHRHRGGES